jgi:hypothetical protein
MDLPTIVCLFYPLSLFCERNAYVKELVETYISFSLSIGCYDWAVSVCGDLLAYNKSETALAVRQLTESHYI